MRRTAQRRDRTGRKSSTSEYYFTLGNSYSRAHPKNPGVELNGAAGCKEFVTHPKTLEPMKRLGARKLLEGVMEAHPYNADLLKLAEETLQYLPATDHI